MFEGLVVLGIVVLTLLPVSFFSIIWERFGALTAEGKMSDSPYGYGRLIVNALAGAYIIWYVPWMLDFLPAGV